jgi:uncharacterized membrane protein YtjA (UPF0391 family)
MLGWMILFALIAIIEAGLAVTEVHPSGFTITTCLVFSALFILSLLTRLVRDRAR